ncbi:MAG: hypothetical protein COB85_09225, partial [Bacteroidetes bacterium]
KYTNGGSLQWVRKGQGPEREVAYDIVVDELGYVYVTGSANGTTFSTNTVTFNTIQLSLTGQQRLLAKYDSNGNIQWVKFLGAYPNDMAIDQSSNLLITGSFSGTVTFDTITLTSLGLTDIYLAKYDSSGSIQWVRRSGAPGDEEGMAVASDASGSAYITGRCCGSGSDSTTFDTITINHTGTSYNAFVAKYDSSGNIQWADIILGNHHELSQGIAVDTSNEVYIAGNFKGTILPFADTVLSTSGYNDAFVAKYGASGTQEWIQRGTGSSYDYATAVGTDTLGNLYLAGNFRSSPFGCDTFLLINNDSGLSDIFVARLSTGLPCNVLASFSPSSTEACINDSISFTNTTSGTTVFEWLENGIPFSTATDTSSVFITAGTYAVTLIADTGLCADTVSMNITVNDITPGASIVPSGSVAFCQGDNVMLNANTGAGFGYAWYLDSVSLAGGLDSSYIASQAGSYTVQITDGGCDSTSVPINLTVNTVFTISATASICQGDSILLGGDYQSSAATYYDTLSTIEGCDSIIITSLTIDLVHTISQAFEMCQGDSMLAGGIYQTAAGTFYDSLYTTKGCDSILITNLSIITVVSSFSASDTSICPGGAVTFINTSMGASNYTWQNNGTTFSSSPDTVWQLFFMSGGTISLIAIDSVSGCNDTSYFTVQVVPGPNPNWSIFIFGLDSSYCTNDNAVTLTGSPVGGTFSGNGISGFLFDPAVAGVGTHAITYTLPPGPGSCLAFTYANVNVSVCAAIDGIGNNLQVSVYPNPFSNETTVRFSNPGGVKHTFYLHDVLGREVKRVEDIRSDKLIFKRGNLSGGIYIYQLEGDKRIIATGKIIINI